jgi:hypothetical protein
MRTYKVDHKNSRRIRFGWRIAANGSQMIDREQQDIITKIIEMRNKGLILQDICDYLNKNGYATPRNGKWYCSTVKKILDLNTRPSHS